MSQARVKYLTSRYKQQLADLSTTMISIIGSAFVKELIAIIIEYLDETADEEYLRTSFKPLLAYGKQSEDKLYSTALFAIGVDYPQTLKFILDDMKLSNTNGRFYDICKKTNASSTLNALLFWLEAKVRKIQDWSPQSNLECEFRLSK